MKLKDVCLVVGCTLMIGSVFASREYCFSIWFVGLMFAVVCPNLLQKR